MHSGESSNEQHWKWKKFHFGLLLTVNKISKDAFNWFARKIFTDLWNMYGEYQWKILKGRGENTNFARNLISWGVKETPYLVGLLRGGFGGFFRGLGQEKLRHIKHTCFCSSSFSRTAFSLFRRSPSRLWYSQRFFFTFSSVLRSSFTFSSSWLSLPFSGEFCCCSPIALTFSVVLYKTKKT